MTTTGRIAFGVLVITLICLIGVGVMTMYWDTDSTRKEHFFAYTTEDDLDVDTLNAYRDIVKKAYTNVLRRLPEKDEQKMYVVLLANDQIDQETIERNLKSSDEYRSNEITSPLPPKTDSMVDALAKEKSNKSNASSDASDASGESDELQSIVPAYITQTGEIPSSDDVYCVNTGMRAKMSLEDAITQCAKRSRPSDSDRGEFDDEDENEGTEDVSDDDKHEVGEEEEEEDNENEQDKDKDEDENDEEDGEDGEDGDGNEDEENGDNGENRDNGDRDDENENGKEEKKSRPKWDEEKMNRSDAYPAHELRKYAISLEKRLRMEEIVKAAYERVYGEEEDTYAYGKVKWKPDELDQHSLDIWVDILWRENEDVRALEAHMRNLWNVTRGFPLPVDGVRKGKAPHANPPEGLDPNPYAHSYMLDLDPLGDAVTEEEKAERKRRYKKGRRESHDIGSKWSEDMTGEQVLMERSKRSDAAKLHEKREKDVRDIFGR